MNELVNHPEWMPLLLDEHGEAEDQPCMALELSCDPYPDNILKAPPKLPW